ncbi:MAG: 2-oxoglutarate dehydrogenase E1 component [Desulfuromonadaceae bacterium]|nr:2-oxoglutarate dehydrogenase E1 component [Desulfuromonadaceae bacterium]MDD4129551.1 2-oxoglutarate dehydrogenase E1 component [Desulfuromonadaceae bacterium]
MNGSFLAAMSGEWFDTLYRDWQRSADSVPEQWRHFFSGFELGLDSPSGGAAFDEQAALKLSGVQSLIYRYRSLGHLQACLDPLSPCQLFHPLLELSNFGLDVSDLAAYFACRRFLKPRATLHEVVETLRDTYCREIGVEFMHIQEPDERQWLIDRMEPCRNIPVLSRDDKLHILEKLHQAALFELFLHRRFVGQKRFSLEGGEILIPVLDRVICNCPEAGVSDVVIGMSHRGRLNVLAHILRKPYETLFAEFKESISPGFIGDGDVKYHKGHSSDIDVDGHQIHVTIAANPSHLEAVNAVVEGKSRARQDRYGADGAGRVLPLLIHGDAAFAGQGSIMEVLNMSQLAGYGTGGTIHVVLNNQIGFTTVPKDSRSTRYATDIAKMLSCPVFHVQGEAPEAAVHVVNLAMEYRRDFSRDVVIELICYRRHGHNEGDEPAFTQPKMYQQIAVRPTINRIYANSLAEEDGISPDALELIEQRVSEALESSFKKAPVERSVGFSDKWSAITTAYNTTPVETAVSVEKLVTLARRLAALPSGFIPHAKIGALIQKRFEAVLKGGGIDWGNAETLAYATLLDQGYSVRISGQDSRRGTFNHRHCVVVDNNDERNYTPLETVVRDGATFQAWNSLLSEFGVLGFEYGYSLETPDCLTLWEAQFGDFANGAQVIIDQFIASGETKWNRASGLVMLLPHGYEGQGGEHSSARIERFLQLCASENMTVVCPSTPAQMFHLLRRQMLQSFRKPLVVFTPKSLLRHPLCFSTVNQCSSGAFEPCIVDPGDLSVARQVLFCSGKIYYELEEERARLERHDSVIVRIEQLYPLDLASIKGVIDLCTAGCRLCWVQEEPENMGAWHYIERYFRSLSASVSYIGRPADACPAVGSHHIHAEQQSEIIRLAFP